jgi:Protein of unknown function (DUF3592)
MRRISARDVLTYVTDKAGTSPTQFWSSAMVFAPVATLVVWGLFAELTAGLSGLEFVGKVLTPFQALLLLGLMLFPVSAFMFARAESHRAQAIASRDWPTVQGTVAKSVMTRRWTGHGVTWALDFACNYEVEGRPYVAEHVQFGTGRTMSRDLIRGFADKYPAGANVAVRYNPAWPEIAALESSEEMSRYSRRLAWALLWPAPVAAVFIALRNA